MLNLDALHRYLGETVSWCSRPTIVGSPETAWRTEFLKPSNLVDVLVTVGQRRRVQAPTSANIREAQKESIYWNQVLPEVGLERQRIVVDLAEKRSELLRKESAFHQQLFNSAEDHVDGHLLICTGDVDSVTDGASQQMSQGFFDEQDMPPWDTWISYVVGTPQRKRSLQPDMFLLSWVPATMTDLVNAAIEANPVDCIHWATEPRSKFTQELQARGIL